MPILADEDRRVRKGHAGNAFAVRAMNLMQKFKKQAQRRTATGVRRRDERASCEWRRTNYSACIRRVGENAEEQIRQALANKFNSPDAALSRLALPLQS
jgi:hypothetical protein